MEPKTNFLNNKDLLLEIHRSKNTFCEYVDDKYNMFDVIVEDCSDCFKEEVVAQALKARQKRLGKDAVVQKEDLVFRVYTFEHIPSEAGRKKNPKRQSDHHVKLNFPPFKHYIFSECGTKLVEVGKSHSLNGEFSMTHGGLTRKLATMCLMMVNKYSQSYNWRGYTYLDEMKGNALLQLSYVALMFNEMKSDNPFAYFTSTMYHAFTRVLNTEKRNQNIRDDILVEAGLTPSFTRQLEVEESFRKAREEQE